MSTTPYYSEKGITLFHGDCLDVMREMESDSVDSIVTDPPYCLNFMGKEWDRSGISYNVEVWRECLRVLKPGGHLLAFGGSRTYHRLACAIEDAGLEIRDQIQWIYGSGFPKSLDVSKAIDAAAGVRREVVGRSENARPNRNGKFSNALSQAQTIGGAITFPATDLAKQWNGWGTALKPAHEPIVLARKPLIGTVAQNILEHGTGGLNIDGCRIEVEKADPNHRVPSRGNNGANSIFGVGGHDGNLQSQGRWPANVIHDGSDEVLAGFPETASGVFTERKTQGIWSQEQTQQVVGGHTGGDSGSAARFFYCAKASNEDREEGLELLAHRSAGEVTDRQDGSDGLNSPRAGAGRTNGSRNFHPTVKPTDLMRYLCRLVTPPSGTVLDPFAGSGSTGKAAMLEGLNFIGIELSAEYCELAEKRIIAATRQGLLFR